MARGAIGGDLDQVLLVTDDFVGAIISWVQYASKLHPFCKGSTSCEMGVILLLALSPSLPCYKGYFLTFHGTARTATTLHIQFGSFLS